MIPVMVKRTTVTLETRCRDDALLLATWLDEALAEEHREAFARSWGVPGMLRFDGGAFLRFDLDCGEDDAAEVVRRALADPPVRVDNIDTREVQ